MNSLSEFSNRLRAKHIDFAVIKLSLFYVFIIMTISAAFSISLYNISTNEIDRGLGRQSQIVGMMGQNPIMVEIDRIRDEQLQESQNHIILNLVYFNLLILVLSAAGSYFFAKKTLEPIGEAMEEQNRFTADASHELRTPLTAMKTEIEVALRDQKLSLTDSKKLLESNLEEIAKLESLSNALLKIAKNDNIKLEFQKVNLQDIIIESFEKIEGLATEKSIKFKNRLLNVVVEGNSQNLIELFVILLDNAIKYSPKNSKIEIEMEEQDKSVLVKIIDEGIGIKASDLPYVFNRFYRADSSRNREKISGYGLGLSIAKQIVELHHGAIAVESTLEKGSQFSIFLPICIK